MRKRFGFYKKDRSLIGLYNSLEELAFKTVDSIGWRTGLYRSTDLVLWEARLKDEGVWLNSLSEVALPETYDRVSALFRSQVDSSKKNAAILAPASLITAYQLLG